MINALNDHRTFLTASAAVAAIVGLSACGSSTEQTTAQPAVAATTDTVAPAAPTTVAPTADEAAAAPTTIVPVADTTDPADAADLADSVETDQFIPASSPDLPCDGYVEVTELPAFVCSQGDVVADFQEFVFYADDTFVVDGFFGEATLDAVIAYQGSFGLEPTGVIDQTLMNWMDRSMLHEEPIDDEQADDSIVDDEAYDAAGADEGEIHDEAMGAYCQELADGLHADASITLEVIEICDDLGVRLTSGD